MELDHRVHDPVGQRSAPGRSGVMTTRSGTASSTRGPSTSSATPAGVGDRCRQRRAAAVAAGSPRPRALRPGAAASPVGASASERQRRPATPTRRPRGARLSGRHGAAPPARASATAAASHPDAGDAPAAATWRSDAPSSERRRATAARRAESRAAGRRPRRAASRAASHAQRPAAGSRRSGDVQGGLGALALGEVPRPGIGSAAHGRPQERRPARRGRPAVQRQTHGSTRVGDGLEDRAGMRCGRRRPYPVTVPRRWSPTVSRRLRVVRRRARCRRATRLSGQASACAACGAATTDPWPARQELERAYERYRPETGRFSGLGRRAAAPHPRARWRPASTGWRRPARCSTWARGTARCSTPSRARGREAVGLERDPRRPDVRDADVTELDEELVGDRVLALARAPARARAPPSTTPPGSCAPGGALVVAVPNTASLQARAFGDRWFHLDLPRHLVHLPADALIDTARPARPRRSRG